MREVLERRLTDVRNHYNEVEQEYFKIASSGAYRPDLAG